MTGTGGAAGTSAGGAGVPSAGCGKTSTLTFGMVPNENANAAAGSGNGVGHGDGGYVTINDSNAGGSRGFALRLPDNYDKTKPYWLIFGFHWNGGNAAQVDNGGPTATGGPITGSSGSRTTTPSSWHPTDLAPGGRTAAGETWPSRTTWSS